MVPSWAIHHHATYSRLPWGEGGRGGVIGRGEEGWEWERGVLPTQASARGRNPSPPNRSRGEALVRLSIPNVLRCLEFFFPDRRYLCRAARGSFFCGE